MPVLLFGSESWYLTEADLDELERFQCSIGRRILRLTRYHSSTSVLIGLDWPSMRARLLLRKLNYLRRLVGDGERKLSSQIYQAFAAKDVSELTIVEQCRFLESIYKSNFTGNVLTSADHWSNIKKDILSLDKELRVNGTHQSISLKHLSTIHSDISWLKIWDMALDQGMRGSRAAVCLFSTLSRPLFGDRLCPRCATAIPKDFTYIEHLVDHHQELELGSVEDIIAAITSAAPDIVTIGRKLMLSMPLF